VSLVTGFLSRRVVDDSVQVTVHAAPSGILSSPAPESPDAAASALAAVWLRTRSLVSADVPAVVPAVLVRKSEKSRTAGAAGVAARAGVPHDDLGRASEPCKPCCQ
jgi:hypothetical protein